MESQLHGCVDVTIATHETFNTIQLYYCTVFYGTIAVCHIANKDDDDDDDIHKDNDFTVFT